MPLVAVHTVLVVDGMLVVVDNTAIFVGDTKPAADGPLVAVVVAQKKISYE